MKKNKKFYIYLTIVISLSISVNFGLYLFFNSQEDNYKNYSRLEFKKNNYFEDGIYRASVNYYNPKTKYTSKYFLNIRVQNGKVTKIIFPKGGYLDKEHINKTQIDNNGVALVIDDRNRKFKIKIFNKL